MLRQQPSAAMAEQAAFIRKTFLSLLESHCDSGKVADSEFLNLIEDTNRFLESHAVDPIALSEIPGVRDSFGDALVEFFNEVNHYSNPLNACAFPSEEAQQQTVNRAWGKLYFAVAEYLHARNVPITRKGLSFSPERRPDPQIKLWKRVVEQGEDGQIASRIEEVEAIDPAKKAVICMGGTASTHGHHPSINGLMKIAEHKLGGPAIYDENIELYCVSYPAAHRPSFFSETHEYNAAPETYYSPTAQQFAERLLIPGIDETTHPDVEHVKSVFSKLNIFAYSYGTVFAQEVRNYLAQALEGRGYDKEAISEAFAEAYSMNIGPTCRLDVRKETGNFSSVYVLSPNDLNVRSRTHNHHLIKDLAEDNRRMKPLSENELLIYSEAPLEGVFFDPAQGEGLSSSRSGTFEMRSPAEGKSGWRETAVRKNPSNHDIRFYTEPVMDGDGAAHVPRYLSYHMSTALGTNGAYRELDERFLPVLKKHGRELSGLRLGSRIARNAYELSLLEALSSAKSLRKP